MIAGGDSQIRVCQRTPELCCSGVQRLGLVALEEVDLMRPDYRQLEPGERRRDDRPACRFTSGPVAGTALPRGPMTPARSHVLQQAPVIMSSAGPRRPADLMGSGLCCAWQGRSVLT